MKLSTTLLITVSCLTIMISPATGADQRASLYERLGGMPSVQAVADQLVDRIMADDRVNRWFSHAASSPERTAAYKAKLAAFICQATGGPCQYDGLNMSAAHKDRGVTAEAFDCVAGHVAFTLEHLKVPEPEKKDVLNLLGSLKPVIVQPVRK